MSLLVMLLRVSSAVTSFVPAARRAGLHGLHQPQSRAAVRRSIVTASAAAKQPAFITTPIYYVNGQPHIGHVYTTLSADVVARFMRLDGHEVKFLTGTDEHGQKVEQSAEAAGVTPLEFADKVSADFRALLPLYNFSCDDFIRTTEPRHIGAVQALWRKLLDSGDIFLGAYKGWYAVRDECFYTEEELVDGVAPTGAPVEWVAEPSYFFALSKWQQPLIEHIEANPDFISPLSRRNEVLAFIKQDEGLRDLSISRTTFKWGVPVPDQPEGAPEQHIMYVWLDALTNYLTAAGYPETGSAEFGKWWPASLHMVGKDILRFHAIYWPAFLLAAGLPLPKKLFAHGWWTRDGQKMSKSIGNVVDPVHLVHEYGCDQVRYFMVNEVAFGSDGDFSDQQLINCINAKLANELGNLHYRTVSFAYKNCDGAVPTPQSLLPEDEEMLALAAGMLPQLRGIVSDLSLHRYTQTVSAVVQAANRYIDVQAPWALRKTDVERMGTVLWVLMEALRWVGIAYQPVTPRLSAGILDQLGVDAAKRDFAFLDAEYALVGGAPLPEPQIIIPRYETEEDKAAKAAPKGGAKAKAAPKPPKQKKQKKQKVDAPVDPAVAAQAAEVRRLKEEEGKDKDDPDVKAAVAELLRLKAAAESALQEA